ncbi:MAG: FtsW/RodA/SpoVE family cell cycle protein [Firmicutes bacterium]|nr:FtsW/RodA/SpoVE family cell cycle protein [Bacillota bacterium]
MENIKQLISDILPQLSDLMSQIADRASDIIKYVFTWISESDITFASVYTQVIRWILPLLALHILLSVIREMMQVKNPKETWGYLKSKELGKFPINHWECTVGRARHCDIIIKFATISRTQCALIRDDDGNWFVHNLSEKDTTLINNKVIKGKTQLKYGDKLKIGGVEFTFEAITKQEHEIEKQKRIKKSRPLPPWVSFITLSVFQLLTLIQLLITRPENASALLSCFGLLAGVMWGYVIFTRALGQTGFEPEILAFFACTLNLAVTASSAPSILLKQTIAIIIGVIGFIILGWYLRDLDRVVKMRMLMAVATVGLFAVNTVFGKLKYGASNWISIFGVSVQPSEFAKICFIFAGAATLDRLFVKRNLFGFMCLSGICLLALAAMGDFGTAAIFFVVFLVIAFMRSGDFATLSLICGAAAGAIVMILRFKPYIAARFAVWGHAWENASDTGYQQVRTMSASASGGFIGVGSGDGWLHNVAAANTDLVFGMLCEEWGLIIALLSIAIIVTLSVFSFRVVQTGRSSYYTIAACAATSLLVFQTILNVFGSVDLLPLTGVTFPFISCGGSSMIASWGLLSFLKAADTRQNASFAVRKKTALGDVPTDPLNSMNNKLQKQKTAKNTRLLSDPAFSGQQDADEIDDFFRQFDDIEQLPEQTAENINTINGNDPAVYSSAAPPGGSYDPNNDTGSHERDWLNRDTNIYSSQNLTDSSHFDNFADSDAADDINTYSPARLPDDDNLYELNVTGRYDLNAMHSNTGDINLNDIDELLAATNYTSSHHHSWLNRTTDVYHSERLSGSLRYSNSTADHNHYDSANRSDNVRYFDFRPTYSFDSEELHAGESSRVSFDTNAYSGANSYTVLSDDTDDINFDDIDALLAATDYTTSHQRSWLDRNTSVYNTHNLYKNNYDEPLQSFDDSDDHIPHDSGRFNWKSYHTGSDSFTANQEPYTDDIIEYFSDDLDEITDDFNSDWRTEI